MRKDKPFPVFIKEVFACADQNPVERFIIDIRNNGGGNSSIFTPMLQELKRREALNHKDRLFVIIGRRTFSSAVLNAIQLRNQTQAVFVGEPSGGRPNHFGEVRMFMLKHSRLPVTYSTNYFTTSQEDTDSFYPDIPVELSIQDFLNHHDPVIEKILTEKPGK
jgi:C-terminal processing protease CtpA/Prc